MLNIVLHRPEIPPNTGNAMRLCANVGATLHLIEPLGFTLETKALRRAGLDYRDLVHVQVHADLDSCLAALARDRPDARANNPPGARSGARSGAGPGGGPGDPASDAEPLRVYAMSTRGDTRHDRVCWQPGDVALFGAESCGLPERVLHDPRIAQRVRLPMRAGMRSLNLSNAIAVVAFEAWRQNDFAGAAD